MLARPAIRLRRWLVAIVVLTTVLLGSAVALLRIRFEGPDLAETLSSMLNRNMRGSIEIGSVEWPMEGMKSMVTGGWVPLTLRDVQVWDDEHQLVLRAPRITAEIDVHALMFGRNDFVFRKIVVHGGDVLLREIEEPYPLHAEDKKVFSLLAAFYAKRQPGFYMGITAGSPPVFDLRDFTIADVDLEIRIGINKARDEYRFRAALTDVDASGFLYMDPSDPLLPKFYFSLAPETGPGQIDLFWARTTSGEWRGAYRFDVERLKVDRLQQIPASWPQSPVANTLRFDLELQLKSAASAQITGRMIEYWGTPYGGWWDLTADIRNAGPMLKESFIPELGGDDVRIRTAITGPIVFSPRIDLTISGLTYDLELLGRQLPLELETLHATYDLAVDTGSVEQFVGRGAGGQLTLSATFEGGGSDQAPFILDARVAIDRPLELQEWMTPCEERLLGGTQLSGHLRARRYKGDTKLVAHVDDFVFDFGRLRVSGEESTPKTNVGILADQAERRLDARDVRVRLGGSTALVNGFYYWETGQRRIEFEGQTGDVVGLINGVTRCRDRAVKAERGPKAATARPRHAIGGPPMRRRGPQARGVRSRGTIVAAPRPAVVHQAQPAPAPARPPATTAPRPAATPPAPARPRARRCQTIALDTKTVWAGDDWTDTNISGTATLTCLPVIDAARVTYRYDGTKVTVENATSSTLGGVVRGSGVIRLNPSQWIERLRIVAENVDLGRIAEAERLVNGRVFADVTVRGPVDPRRVTAEGWACANKVSILGDAYADVGVWLGRAPAALPKCKSALPPVGDHARCLEVGRAGGRCMIARARREAGGEVSVALHADRDQRLGGQVSATSVPLGAVAALVGATLPAGATVDARGLVLGGTVDAPTFAGTVRLSRAWLLDTFVGDGDLVLSERGPGVVALAGSFLDGRFTIAGTLGTAPPYKLDVTVEATRIAVDALIDLAALTGLPTARAAVSGRVRVRTALGDPEAALDVAIALSELTTTVAVPGFGPQPAPIDVRLAAPVSATYDGTMLVLSQPATFTTPLGAITVQGQVGKQSVRLEAAGALDLSRARPLFGRVLDDARGKAELSATIEGPLGATAVKASLDLDDVAIRRARQDAVLRIPSGRIALAGGQVLFTGVELLVDDGYARTQASLRVKGGLELADYRPRRWNLVIEGDLAGEMVVAALPELIASASGAADVTVTLQGDGPVPMIDAVITFDPARPLTVLPRAARREIALSEGTITLVERPAQECGQSRPAGTTCKQIELDEVGGSIDGEGRLRGIRGTVDLIDWKVVGADVMASADAVPYRVPRLLDLVVNIDGLRGVYDERDGLEVAGKVELVSGRYLENFDIGEVLRPATAAPSAPPFWESWTPMANARLDLLVDARRFSVVNNLANIDMFGQLAVKGTPRDPRLEGVISVNRGQFRIPGLRARFSRTSGTVTFSEMLPSGQTPRLDITSEADYRDPSGTDHLITLRVEGPLRQPNWDLYTASGLNKGQTLTLIISGKTPDQFRRNLGQEVIGGDPTRVNPSTDASEGYTDELIRQAAGDYLSRALGDTLRTLSRLDVARIEFNLGSFGFHGEKRLLENTQLVGDLERTTRGSTVSGRAELRLLESFYAEASLLMKNFDDVAERDVNDVELKVVWRGAWRTLVGP